MRFVLMTALRETRSAWKRLIFFFVCIAIGVGAIVALRSVIQSVRHVLATEARSLMAADIFLSTDRPWQSGTPRADCRLASRAFRTRAYRLHRNGDDGAAGGRARRHHEGRRASRGAARISVLRPPDPPGWAAVLPLAAAEQRRARAPGASRAVRPVGWRCHRDRQGAVRRPRRHCARARPLAQRVQPRTARVHRLRRSRRDGLDHLRQPRLAPDAASRARSRDRHAHARAAGRAAGRSSCACARTAIVRSRSAKTSSARKTISVSSASSSSCSAASPCRVSRACSCGRRSRASRS